MPQQEPIIQEPITQEPARKASFCGPSAEFKMSASRFAADMVFQYAWAWLLSLSLLGIAGLLIGIAVDIRWFVCGLLVIFVALPMLLVYLYYYYGLRREAYVNTVTHTVELAEEGLLFRLRFSTLPKEGSNVEVESDESLSDGPEFTLRDEFFPLSSMKGIKIGFKAVHVELLPPLKGFLWIPAAAFPSADEFNSFLETLSRAISGEIPAGVTET